jgi:hypothetical protein
MPYETIAHTTQKLRVALTDDEIAQKSIEYANRQAEIEEYQADEKNRAAFAKKTIARMTSDALELRRCVLGGEEYRPVECFLEADTSRKTINTIREDTGKVVASRPMTDSEVMEYAQEILPGVLALHGEDEESQPRKAR